MSIKNNTILDNNDDDGDFEKKNKIKKKMGLTNRMNKTSLLQSTRVVFDNY